MENVWQPVVYAGDCVDCPLCGEPVCYVCADHFSDCDCPGVTMDDDYEYSDHDGFLWARRREDHNL